MTSESLDKAVVDELDRLVTLPDEELWQTARMRVGTEAEERMEHLLWKQQASGLSAAEMAEAEAFAALGDRIMLLRAKAFVLLKERGHDIAVLRP